MSLKKMPRKLEMNTINFGVKEGNLGCFKEIKMMCANWSIWGDVIWNDRIWHRVAVLANDRSVNKGSDVSDYDSFKDWCV